MSKTRSGERYQQALRDYQRTNNATREEAKKWYREHNVGKYLGMSRQERQKHRDTISDIFWDLGRTPPHSISTRHSLSSSFYRKILDEYKRNNNASEREARRWWRESRAGEIFRMSSQEQRRRWREFRQILWDLGRKRADDTARPGETPRANRGR